MEMLRRALPADTNMMHYMERLEFEALLFEQRDICFSQCSG